MQKEESTPLDMNTDMLSLSPEDITVTQEPTADAEATPNAEPISISAEAEPIYGAPPAEDAPSLSREEREGERSAEETNAPSAQEGEETHDSDTEAQPPESPLPSPAVAEAPKARGIDNRFDFLEIFIFSLAVVLLLSAFVFRHAIVDGGSMENTLLDGEHLIISDLFYTPQCGDIVVCEDYHTGYTKPLIKRVIATEGQTIRITPTAVYVDGVRLEEDYVHLDDKSYRYTPIEEYTVPSGMLFLMGDHRDSSTDSRIFGCVSEDAVLGRVLFRYSPLSRFGAVS